MTFQYCATCRRERSKSKAFDEDSWVPCKECFDRRQKYSDQLHRDRAYRSHLARQIAGYPCNRRSDSLHNLEDYLYFRYPSISFVENGYAELVKTPFANVGLCQNCLSKRNKFIEDNHGYQTEFKLPLERARVDYIDDYYPPVLGLDQDPFDGEKCETDDYFEKYILCPPQEPREYEASLPDVAVIFGDEATAGTYTAIETALYLARQQQW